ncbi:ATP-dependent protease subunit HslV [Striga asiatica]|uniref:ATP-dependent protease subunit HslV n=1 Tax=Striga asiatica TaxID=4170 RepID=A0A5A7R880_STRAF|nr:ATP-dependent protease subunit HslV [Striga asiatica]
MSVFERSREYCLDAFLQSVPAFIIAANSSLMGLVEGLTDLICVDILNNGVNYFLARFLCLVSKCISELFDFYVSTLVFIEEIKGFLEMLVISHLLQVYRDRNKLTTVEISIFIHVTL